MMTLIGFAITVAYIYSAAIVFGLKGMDFFWELTTLILIMLLGHWIEMRSVAGASRELELLVQLMPAEAHLIKGDDTIEVKTDTLKSGDLILIKPGEKIADSEIYNSRYVDIRSLFKQKVYLQCCAYTNSKTSSNGGCHYGPGYPLVLKVKYH